jgi:hypothetical protein
MGSAQVASEPEIKTETPPCEVVQCTGLKLDTFRIFNVVVLLLLVRGYVAFEAERKGKKVLKGANSTAGLASCSRMLMNLLNSEKA